MKFRAAAFLPAWAALVGLAAFARAAADTPNIIILLDTSGSMVEFVPSLPPFDSGAAYPTAPGYVPGAVYELTNGSTTTYAAAVSGVASAGARAALSSYGFWFGTVGTSALKLFTGNYLNYAQQPVTTTFRKIAIAQRVIAELVSTMPNARFAVMDFKYDATHHGQGGEVVAPFAASSSAIVAAVNAISVNTQSDTPLGPALSDAGVYLQSGLDGYPSPVTSACQPNSIIVISDGLFNAPNNTGGDPVSDPAVVAARLHESQGLVINAIGLNLPSDAAIASLRQTAANGGGDYFPANNSTDLEAALFSLPAGVVIANPPAGSVLSGTVNLGAYVQTPAECVSALQFYLSGAPILSQLTAPPFSAAWDTTQAANGNYTLAVGMIGVGGVQKISYPISVGINNVVTWPVVSAVRVEVGVTTAAISWQTNVAADAQVFYGLTSGYGQSTVLQDVAPRTLAHSVSISGLTPATLYNFEIVSRDAAGRSATSQSVFATQGASSGGALDHFKIVFLSNGLAQNGPGSKSGSYPYVLSAGDCFAASVEAVDAVNNHNNYTGPVALAQYSLGPGGVEIELAPGIALRDDPRVDLSSMTLAMTNGFAFLGSQTDISKQLCFFQASREPGDSKPAGAPGDFELKAGTSSVAGVCASYVVWRGPASRLRLDLAGGAAAQNRGTPFLVRAEVDDAYGNPVRASADELEFSSSLATMTAFSPWKAAASAGVVVASVTANFCDAVATLAVRDASNPAVEPAQAEVSVAPCGAQRFYTIAIPSQAVAGAPFVATITARNLDLSGGSGELLCSGNMTAQVQAGAAYFSTATQALGVPVFSFTVPEGVSGDYSHAVLNQSYRKAETIWVALSARNPPDLAGASVLAGPLQVLPGPAARLTLTAQPAVIGAFAAAQVTAALSDALGNGIAGQNVVVSLTRGAGTLGSGSLSQTVATDAAGRAVVSFTGGGVSQVNELAALAPGLPALPAVSAQILVSLLGDAALAAYPSPVNFSRQPLTIEYELAQNSEVTLTVADLFGHKAWEQSYPAGGEGGAQGFNRVSWDGRNSLGRGLAAGAYVLRLRVLANGQTTVSKAKFGVSK